MQLGRGGNRPMTYFLRDGRNLFASIFENTTKLVENQRTRQHQCKMGINKYLQHINIQKSKPKKVFEKKVTFLCG